MKRPTEVIVTRTASSSLEQIRADIGAAFDNARVDIDPSERRARSRTRVACSFGLTVVDSVDCAGGWMRGGIKQGIKILFTTRGGVVARHPRTERASPPGSIATWAMAGDYLDLRTFAGTSAGSVSFDPDNLAAAGRALLGEEFRFRVPPAASVSEAPAHAFARNATFAFRELIDLEKVGLAHLVAISHEDSLSNLAIAMLFPEAFAASEDYGASPSSVARRACEILEARAGDPISINSLASELGVTVRALQLSFRKHRGETPMQFLMAQRMMMARNRLLNPNPRDNVQSVAMGCGFSKMSQFATRYREEFGELPSQTLARAR